MMEMLQNGAFSIVAGLFMISVLVVVHEAGHFFAAKLFGVDVPVFSIGMGPRLFGVRWRGTDYRVSAFLVGGYVQMAGADPFGEEDTSQDVPSDRDFMKKPVWQRLIIMAAGPGVNLALPFVLFTILLMLGRPDWNSRVGEVLPGTLAADLGVRPGDRVVSVDGDEVEVWKEVEDALEARVGTTGDVALKLDRGGRPVDVALPASVLRHDTNGVRLDLVGVGLVTDGYQPFFLSTRVGLDTADSPAGRAGLVTGDRIRSVDGQDVETWDAMMAALAAPGPHTVAYERVAPDAKPEDEPTKGTATLAPDAAGPAGAGTAWSNPWGLAPIAVFAGRVEEGSPAERAGVKPGDRFLKVDGAEVLTFHHFIDLVARTTAETGVPRALELVVVRDGQQITLSMTPELKVVTGEAHQRPILGVGSYGGMGMPIDVVRKYHSFFEAVPRAVEESVTVIESTAAILGNVLTRRAKASENVGGPIAIFDMASKVASEGFFPYVAVIGMISVSLGVINLLPVPVFDGGQIVFYALEAIRGRPLSLELRERFQMIGVVGLMILMLLVTANDLSRVAGL